MEPALIRVDEAAEYSAIGRSTPYELTARGDIPTVRYCRAARVRELGVDALLTD